MYGILFPVSNGKFQEIPMGHVHDHAKVEVIATALFPRIAILNHSCDPNIRNFFEGNVLTIRATQPIRNNEEIFNGYCPSFRLLEMAKRRQLLKDQYGFDCDCAKCDETSEILMLQV